MCTTWMVTTVESSFKRVSLKPRVIFFFQAKKAIYTFGSNFLSSVCYYGRSCVHSLTDQLLSCCRSPLRSKYIPGEGVAMDTAPSKLLSSGRKSEREGPQNSCARRTEEQDQY